MKINRFTHKPVEIEAVQITPKNINDVMSWLIRNDWVYGVKDEADIFITSNTIPTFMTAGAWVVKDSMRSYFQVIDNEEFIKLFEPVR